MASISKPLTCSGAVAFASLTRFFRSCSKNSVAPTPASAMRRADSSSSYRASSICVPVKTWAMLEPVLRRPWRSLSNHDWRSGLACVAVTAGEGASVAVDATGVDAGAVGAGRTGAGGTTDVCVVACAGADAGALTAGAAGASLAAGDDSVADWPQPSFFLMKLNIPAL